MTTEENNWYRLFKEIPWRFVGTKVDPDAEELWSVRTEGNCMVCGDGSSPPVVRGVDGLATVTAAGSYSPPTWFREEETWPEAAALGWVENTKKCGRPWEDDLFLWPSLLPKCRVLPIAAAAAKCWIIRSSRSASLASTGNWITMQKIKAIC